MYVCMNGWLYVCSVCMYACMYVCMYVCMYLQCNVKYVKHVMYAVCITCVHV